MKLAFTICAKNYLGKAKVLADSLLEHEPDCRFVIFLADRLDGVDLRGFESVEVVPVESIDISGLPEMLGRYSAIELSTAVKPGCFAHLLRSHPAADVVWYFDPDMMMFASLSDLETMISDSDILLTPHCITPVYEEPDTREFIVLGAGVYNLGFIGLRRCENTNDFLRWWASRIEKHCRRDPKFGLFYDQSWINFAPVYFPRVKISKHRGMNAASWNLYERMLSPTKDGFLVNDNEPLIFYHFSGFQAFAPGEAADKSLWRVAGFTRPDAEPLYAIYHDRLLRARHFEFRSQPYAFSAPPDRSASQAVALCFGASARLAKRVLPRGIATRVRHQLEHLI